MPALITLSHGSRHPGAAAGIERLTQATGLRPARAAHLEFNEPDLTTAALELAQLGETEAVVVPLLFTQGYHQRVDVPRALADASQYRHSTAAAAYANPPDAGEYWQRSHRPCVA